MRGLNSGLPRLILGNLSVAAFRPHVRNAGIKKKPNYSDNPSKYRPSIKIKMLRGFQFNDGDYVYEGDILVRQLTLDIYPGESVKFDRETWNLIASCNGRFTISTETLRPFQDSPLFSTVQGGEVITKPFVHVISDPIEPVYKLKRLL